MLKVIMTKGLPGSGKSFWAHNIAKSDPSYVVVTKDDIRAMLGNKWTKSSEKLVLSIRDEVIGRALESGKNVIVADTNFNPIHEKTIRRITEICNADFEVKFFDTPIWTCLERDAVRPNSVGPKVIWGMYNQYIAPEINKSKSEWSCEEGKKKALIVDMDGNLSHKSNRDIFDYTRVKEDYCDVVIKDIVNTYAEAGFEILIVSGRDNNCQKETEEWLRDNGIIYKDIFMRKTGDKRPDSEVKKEIYENFINPYYSIFFCLDDRDSITQLWRSLGLKSLQTEYGNF